MNVILAFETPPMIANFRYIHQKDWTLFIKCTHGTEKRTPPLHDAETLMVWYPVQLLDVTRVTSSTSRHLLDPTPDPQTLHWS